MSDVASASQPDPRRPATPAGDGAPVSLAAVNGLLRGLNREQRAAVTHADGPQLVVAGPGTGKTEVVTRRVAWLIATRRARPREILALTFTDNAADEMQARVDTLVPYGQADAHVHTFHAFGDRLLREFSFELGLPGDVRLLSRADLIVLLREQLFDLGLRRYLPLGDPGRFLGALVDLFGRAKDEDVTPDRLASHAAELLANSAAAEEPARSALADLAAARSELAIAYGRYCRLLGERGCIDHADQISLPLRLLRQRPAVRDAVQRRYRHVLVDELQDTNRAQLELVLAVAGDRANVTVVGDADQGIYAFRGAASGNLARFGAAYPAARQIVLRRNYRSRSPILKASGRLIRAIERGAHDRRPVLVAHRRARRPAAVRQLVFATPEEEADGIAERIARRIEQGVQPADFAVLVRSNGETDAILRSLRVRGVAAQNGARVDLFSLPAVRSLLAYLRIVADQSASLELYVLAAGEPYELAGSELASLLGLARRQHRSLWEVLIAAAGDESGALLSPPARRAAQRLVEHVSAGIALSAERASGEVLYDYLRRSGMLGRLARFADDGPDVAGLRGVVRFFELVRDRASLLALDRLPFLVPHLVTPVDVAEDMQTGPDDQRVAVLTVHRAKGLEFRHVIVAGLVDGRFPVRGRPPALALPPELAGGPGGDPDEEHMAEERRLFYVAMTRARDELWLSYHTAGPNGRGRRRPSPFIAEALDLPVAPPPAGSAVTATPLEDVSRIVRCAPDPAVEEPVRSAPGGPLSLSFSQVDDYLSCPERYRLRHVVGLPTPAHHALSYGGAMHQAVAAFHLRAGQGKTMTETELLAELNRHWTPQGFLSREHEEARHAAGRVALRRFRQQQLTAPASVVAVERPFRFRLGDDQIVGRVDRVDQLPDGGTVITDYKTSDVREQRRADARARDSLQLHVYALAQQAETGVPPADIQLHFLDSGVVGRAVPDEARLEKARQKLTAVADGIRAGEFAPKPNAVACGYCPFRQICPSSAA